MILLYNNFICLFVLFYIITLFGYLFPQISLFSLSVSKAEFSFITLPPHPTSSVLNETLAIDIACQSNAEEAGFRVTFVAFVSRPARSLKQLLELQRGDNLPVIKTKVLWWTTVFP